jgi:methylamine dehydrogenase accessory protein MauD
VEGWWAVSYVVLWILVAVLCATVVALARQVGVLHLRLGPRGALEIDDEGPPLGERIDALETADASGAPVTVAARGEAQLLLFVSPGCPVCDRVLPSVAALARGGELAPYVLVDADREDALAMFDGRRMHAPLVPGAALARALAVPGTPYAIVIDETGVVRAKGTVNDLEQIEGLAGTAMSRVAAANGQAAAA